MSLRHKKSPSHRDGRLPAVPPYLPSAPGSRVHWTSLAGHHHVPLLLTGNEPGLSLLAADFGRRISAGSSGGILGGTTVPAFTGSGSLRRSSSAYSSPSQLFTKNSNTGQLPGQLLGFAGCYQLSRPTCPSREDVQSKDHPPRPTPLPAPSASQTPRTCVAPHRRRPAQTPRTRWSSRGSA